MSEKSSTLFSKAPLEAFMPSSNLFSDLDKNTKTIENAVQELLFTCITEGLRNKAGKYRYEEHELTWELRTGVNCMSLTKSIIKYFSEKFSENSIDARVIVKEDSNNVDVWVVFKETTPLEVDLKVSRFFCELEKKLPNNNLSLYMATENEVNENGIASL